MCFLKDRGMPCLVKGRGKKTCNVEAIKRDASVFFCCHNANAASIFSETYTVFYGDVNSQVTGHGLKTRGKKRGQLTRDITEVQRKARSVWECLESSELQDFLQSQRSEEGRENTKDTLGHKSPPPPSLAVPLGKVMLSQITFFFF